MRHLLKILSLLLFVTMLATSAKAQPAFRKPVKEAEYRSSYSNYHLGLKLGCPWSHLMKSDITPHYLGHFGGQLGITAERNFRSLSVGVEVLWAQRGTKMYGQSTFQSSLHDIDTMRYELAIAYDVVTLRVPLTWYLLPPASTKVTPYLFVAPAFEHGLKKTLNRQLDSLFTQPFTDPSITHTEIVSGRDPVETTNSWEPPLYDVTVVAGTGVMVNLPVKSVALHLKMDVGINLGVLNLANKELKEQGVSIHSGGLEAGLTLLFDINPPLRDACYYFNK